jgi:glycosyltransferase involved in cell wall biosynthesis
MRNIPLVSVILIFFNEERFITEAIESVLAQTFESWELLLVNDGSRDRSGEIAGSYVRQQGRIYYLEHPGGQNLGMSASRNLGIQKARGKYLAFIDGDDVWLPEKLEQQVAIMETQADAALVCGRTQWWYGWTGKESDRQRDFIQKLDLPLNTLIEPPKLLLLFLQNEWASLHDILVRREAVTTVGGYENSFPGMYEDQVFHAKLCLKFPAYISDRCWCRYRQHSEAHTFQTHDTKNGYFQARKTFLTWLAAYSSQQSQTEIYQIVDRELWHYRYPLLSRIMSRLHRLKKDFKYSLKQIVPKSLAAWLKTQWLYNPRPPVGWVRWGSLRRLTPISKPWPNYRGAPLDRYYIEQFLEHHASDIHGRVLELGDATYTKRFGGDRVTHSDVLEAEEGNPAATIVADLTDAPQIADATFDTIILTQTLLLIYDLPAAIATLHRILKPGGILLATVPGITSIIRDDSDKWGQYWSFTQMSVRRLFGDVFSPENIQVRAYGNVMSATGFLYGLGTQELRRTELDYHDPDYQLIIGVRAIKS